MQIDSDEQMKIAIGQETLGDGSTKIPKTYGLATEYATANRWVGYFPIANVLGQRYSDLEMNLVSFDIPQIVMGSTTQSFKGYTMEFPTKVMDPETKEITISYIIDAKWENYKALYSWVSSIEGNINRIDGQFNAPPIKQGDFIDCSIWLTDHFKNRIIDFKFRNCWIKTFNDLSLEASNTSEIVHSFTMAYSNFEIVNSAT